MKKRAGTWALLGTLLMSCVAVIVFPILVLRPFAHQAAGPLSLALKMLRWDPWFTLIAFLAGVLLIGRGWVGRGERLRILKNALMLGAVACLGLCAWASRINIYERLFRPVGDARFAPAAQVALRADDMVIAVSINGADRAYPVLQMAYHHVLNDVVGGIPIVVTY